MKKQITNSDLVSLINKKFGNIDKKFGNIDKKLDNIDKKFGNIDNKLDTLGKKVIMLDKKVDNKTSELEEKMFKWKSGIVDSVDALAKEINDQRDFRDITTGQITEVAERVDNLEKKVFGKVCMA